MVIDEGINSDTRSFSITQNLNLVLKCEFNVILALFKMNMA